GGRRIPDRREALGLVRIVESLDAAIESLGGSRSVELWVTSARPLERTLTFDEARARLAGEGEPVLIAFGTGWGLAPAVLSEAHECLEPIVGERDGYNHLSVRAACAIVLDRLLGRR
ncbi:MAG TPA: RNA methyltransferase, partial [Polyangiaceae bacterium]|nr:RNA methyltransferase [Polyangiaceae bacterium]